MRIPKLRGFKNRFKIEYEVVNVGAIGALAERGAFELEVRQEVGQVGPITVNQDILRAVGLVRTLNKPLKILGAGELSVPLFVVADAFTASARAKIEAAGGSVNVLEVPSKPLAALGVTPEGRRRAPPAEAKASRQARRQARRGRGSAERRGAEAVGQASKPRGEAARPTQPPRRDRGRPQPRHADGRPARRRRPPERPPSPTDGRRGRRRRPATTPDPCSNPFSTPSGRRTSGGGSCSSSGC